MSVSEAHLEYCQKKIHSEGQSLFNRSPFFKQKRNKRHVVGIASPQPPQKRFLPIEGMLLNISATVSNTYCVAANLAEIAFDCIVGDNSHTSLSLMVSLFP